MTARAEREAEVAREAPHIEALGGADGHRRDRPFVADERDLVDAHRARRKLWRRIVAGQRVGALSADMHGAERRRPLHGLARERRKRAFDRLARRRRGDGDLAALALAVVRRGEGREVDLGLVALLRGHQRVDRLRRAAERDDEDARRQGVERARVARLGAACAAPQDLDRAHRAHADLLVEDEDSREVAVVAHGVSVAVFHSPRADRSASMAAMDGTSMTVGIVIGCALGAAAAAVFFMLKGRASAQALAAAEAAQTELSAARTEVATLRTQAGAAQQAEAGAKASLMAAQEQLRELRAQVDAERQRAEQEAALRSGTQQELRAAEERITERESAMQRVLAEREKSIVEQKASIEQSKASLTETFKATGADVLKQTAEQLLRQAKEQFEGQNKLSQQELESRQKAIDATLLPLKEQLAKNEQLVKELGEKREGDVKTLGEQLKQIADLQQKASAAAQTLSSALRDNRQRGRWARCRCATSRSWPGSSTMSTSASSRPSRATKATACAPT